MSATPIVTDLHWPDGRAIELNRMLFMRNRPDWFWAVAGCGPGIPSGGFFATREEAEADARRAIEEAYAELEKPCVLCEGRGRIPEWNGPGEVGCRFCYGSGRRGGRRAGTVSPALTASQREITAALRALDWCQDEVEAVPDSRHVRVRTWLNGVDHRGQWWFVGPAGALLRGDELASASHALPSEVDRVRKEIGAQKILLAMAA